MAKEEFSVPKERVRIVYKPAAGDDAEEVELPLKLLVIDDFTQQEDSRPVEEREPLSITRKNFNDVLKAQNLRLDFVVPLTLGDEKDARLPVHLAFSHIKDFEPDQLVRQVEPLRKLMELREALKTVKSPMADSLEFRQRIRSLIEDKTTLDTLLKKIGLEKNE